MDRHELVQMIKEGLSSYKIAARIGKSQTSVRHWLKKYGLKTNPNAWHATKPKDGTCRFCNNTAIRGGVCSSCLTLTRKTRAKLAAVQYLGGRCLDCGWQGSDAECVAFEFHHMNSNNKDAELGKILNKSWDVVKQELNKCILLCSRCHRIRHANRRDGKFMDYVRSYKGHTLNFSDVPVTDYNRKPSVSKRSCLQCGEKYPPKESNQKYCSPRCYNKPTQNPNKPTKEELIIAMGDRPNFSELGRKYGVSYTAVRKWAQEYGLETKKISDLHEVACTQCGITFHQQKPTQRLCSRHCADVEKGYRPPPSQASLLHALSTMRMKDISAHFGVSRATIHSWKEKLGLAVS